MSSADDLPAHISVENGERYTQLQLQALDLARKGGVEELQRLLAGGLPVNLSDRSGNSLLMLAAYNNHCATLTVLIAAGADLERRNRSGQTPLGAAAFNGCAEAAKLLIASGSNPRADQGGGQTPSMFAELFGSDDIADLLGAALLAETA